MSTLPGGAEVHYVRGNKHWALIERLVGLALLGGTVFGFPFLFFTGGWLVVSGQLVPAHWTWQLAFGLVVSVLVIGYVVVALLMSVIARRIANREQVFTVPAIGWVLGRARGVLARRPRVYVEPEPEPEPVRVTVLAIESR